MVVVSGFVFDWTERFLCKDVPSHGVACGISGQPVWFSGRSGSDLTIRTPKDRASTRIAHSRPTGSIRTPYGEI